MHDSAGITRGAMACLVSFRELMKKNQDSFANVMMLLYPPKSLSDFSKQTNKQNKTKLRFLLLAGGSKALNTSRTKLCTIAWKSTCALTRALAICAEFWKCTLSATKRESESAVKYQEAQSDNVPPGNEHQQLSSRAVDTVSRAQSLAFMETSPTPRYWPRARAQEMLNVS